MTEIKPEQRHRDAAAEYISKDFPDEIEALATTIAKFEAEHQPTPSDAGLREAVEPWSDYHGELPDYDHPLRCVYESGIQYAVEVLAKTLGVNDYSICDGTEEFDGDLGGTMMNIVLEALPKDKHGDPIYPEQVREMFAALQSSPSLEPTPSDAGLREALVKARDLLDCIEQRSADNFWWVNADDPETAVCDTYSATHAALLQAESLWPADWPFAERLAEFLSRGPYEQETIQRNKSASIVMLSYNDLLADAKELLAALQSSQPPTSLDSAQEQS